MEKISEWINSIAHGCLKFWKSHGSRALGSYARGTFECCYDVLNNIAINSLLAKSNCYEVDLASPMLDSLNDDDLLIFDRAYASYLFMSLLISKNKKFIIRCPKNNFTDVSKMFNNKKEKDRLVKINVPVRHAKKARELGLPASIKLRLIKVTLPTNEIEVLATSLVKDEKFSPEDFKFLYSLRWGIETFFGKLKGRLSLENFSGKTLEAVKQDFWSTIFISNLETIMIEDILLNLNNNLKEGQLEKTVNKSVSFNAIKNLAFELICTKIGFVA